jgi:hypothetical protein
MLAHVTHVNFNFVNVAALILTTLVKAVSWQNHRKIARNTEPTTELCNEATRFGTQLDTWRKRVHTGRW